MMLENMSFFGVAGGVAWGVRVESLCFSTKNQLPQFIRESKVVSALKPRPHLPDSTEFSETRPQDLAPKRPY